MYHGPGLDSVQGDGDEGENEGLWSISGTSWPESGQSLCARVPTALPLRVWWPVCPDRQGQPPGEGS